MGDNAKVVNSRRGRPPGRSDARERVIEAAKTVFMEVGYARASLRMIAQLAGVSHSVVNYHFGSKQGLFGEVMSLTLTPSQVLGEALRQRPGETPAMLARRFVGTVVTVWDDAHLSDPFVAMLREAMAEESMRSNVAEFMEREVLAVVATRIGGPDATVRAAGVGMCIAGLVMGRYLLRVGPLVALSKEEIVRVLAPMVAVHLR